MDGGEGSWTRFGERDVQDEVCHTAHAYYSCPQGNRQDFGSIEPRGAVQHTPYSG